MLIVLVFIALCSTAQAEKPAGNNAHLMYDNNLGSAASQTYSWTVSSDVCTCNSCNDCEAKLNDPSCSVVALTADVSSSGTCIDSPSGFNNKTFDCQGNSITITGQYYPGIYIRGKSGNTIRNCNISTSGRQSYGIRLWNSHNNSLLLNTISTSGDHGIYLGSSFANAISSNTISTSAQHSHGIRLSGSRDNRLLLNTISASGPWSHGISLEPPSCNNNTLSSNTISASGLQSYGIELWNSYRNNLSSNTISTSGRSSYGIRLSGSSANALLSNTISTSGESSDGILLFLSYINNRPIISSGNTISSNGITTSGESSFGIFLKSSIQ